LIETNTQFNILSKLPGYTYDYELIVPKKFNSNIIH